MGLSGASFEALIRTGSDLRLHHICRVCFFWPFLVFWSLFKLFYFVSLPPPLKLEDGVIAALAFALAVCQMLEVKVSSQEKDLARKVWTAGIKGREPLSVWSALHPALGLKGQDLYEKAKKMRCP